jgi:hypothetical protein
MEAEPTIVNYGRGQRMLKPAEEGNPPEIRAKLDAAAARLRAAMEARGVRFPLPSP